LCRVVICVDDVESHEYEFNYYALQIVSDKTETELDLKSRIVLRGWRVNRAGGTGE